MKDFDKIYKSEEFEAAIDLIEKYMKVEQFILPVKLEEFLPCILQALKVASTISKATHFSFSDSNDTITKAKIDSCQDDFS